MTSLGKSGPGRVCWAVSGEVVESSSLRHVTSDHQLLAAKTTHSVVDDVTVAIGSTLPLHHSMSADCLSDMTPGHRSATAAVDDDHLRDVDESLTEQQLVLNHLSQDVMKSECRVDHEPASGDQDVNCSPSDVDLSVVATDAGSRLDNSAALHRRAVKPRRQRPLTQFHCHANDNDELFQMSGLVSAADETSTTTTVTRELRPCHSLEDISDKDIVGSARHEDKVALSQSSSRECPPKPVARQTKAAAAGMNEMILRRHTAMFQKQKGDASSSRVDVDVQLKPPVPIFRRKKQPTMSVKQGGETDKQTAGPSELAAMISRVHRRTDSDSSIEMLRSERPAEIPSVKTVTFQQTQKPETVQKSLPLQNPKSAQKSKLSVKPSVRVETSDVTRRTEVSVQPEKKSSTVAEADDQAVAVDDVEKRPAKPLLPPKTGVLSQKTEHALKTNHSRVVKPSLSLPASSITTALPANEEQVDFNVERNGNKFQVLRIPEVKLRSTSPSLKTPATLTSELVHSDSALNTVGLESTGSTENDAVVRGKIGEDHGSAEQLAPGSLKTVSAESELGRKWSAKKNRAKIALKDGDSEFDETEMTKESGKDTSASCHPVNSSQTTSSHQTTAVPQTTQSETTSRRPQEYNRSEPGPTVKTETVKTEASRPESLSTATTWQQKSSMTATADKGPEADKPSLTDECDTAAADTFVPVSKRATMFGSSLLSSGRQSSVKPAGSMQVDVSDSVSNAVSESSGVTRSVASRVASIAACSTDRQPLTARTLKTSVTTTDESNVQSTHTTGTSACEAKNEVVIRAADVGRCPPPTKSDKVALAAERPPPLKATAVKSVAEKLSANVGTSAGKQAEKPDENTSVVTEVVQKAPDKTTAPSWVKQSRTFSSIHQSKDSSSEPVSKKAGPDKAESGSSAVVSSVPSWVKPSLTTSPKQARKNSPQETSVTSSSCSLQSVSGGQAGMAASAKMTTSLVAVETKNGVPKLKSRSVKDVMVDRGTVKPTTESVVLPPKHFAAGKQPVTSGEPIWLSLAQEKSRVWTEGKISSE